MHSIYFVATELPQEEYVTGVPKKGYKIGNGSKYKVAFNRRV